MKKLKTSHIVSRMLQESHNLERTARTLHSGLFTLAPEWILDCCVWLSNALLHWKHSCRLALRSDTSTNLLVLEDNCWTEVKPVVVSNVPPFGHLPSGVFQSSDHSSSWVPPSNPLLCNCLSELSVCLFLLLPTHTWQETHIYTKNRNYRQCVCRTPPERAACNRAVPVDDACSR